MEHATVEEFTEIHGSATLTLLRNKCSTALQHYLETTKEGYALLARVQEIPMPENERNDIFSQRRRELWAHAAYTRVRRQLWDFLINFRAPEHE